MMTIDPEEIVQIALDACYTAYGDKGVDLLQFELQLRRLLMKKHSSTPSAAYTYKLCPPSLTGTWENNQQLLKG
jgi:hypothetical protein